ncbi:hypothetical protein T4D_13199 [Trichinella pseudospiralis]|uniref:Uncharacterized protein n=1 Tax=Trichinella pseudospiralis TaxID=6337 RepID=A0A0V1FN77_TRIPS|nr:hypothetical protein T4D_13199 [Trichinella pseudospiralis]
MGPTSLSKQNSTSARDQPTVRSVGHGESSFAGAVKLFLQILFSIFFKITTRNSGFSAKQSRYY